MMDGFGKRNDFSATSQRRGNLLYYLKREKKRGRFCVCSIESHIDAIVSSKLRIITTALHIAAVVETKIATWNQCRDLSNQPKEHLLLKSLNFFLVLKCKQTILNIYFFFLLKLCNMYFLCMYHEIVLWFMYLNIILTKQTMFVDLY